MTYISRVISRIRKSAHEQSTDAVYSDADLIELMQDIVPNLMTDLYLAGSQKARSRVDITTVADQEEYALPPHVGSVLGFAKINTKGAVLWERNPKSFWNPWGYGWAIEGNIIRLQPTWQSAETMRLTYLPNGECSFINGTLLEGSTLVHTTTVLYIQNNSTQVPTGTVDTRDNAYAGYILNLTFNADGAGGTNLKDEVQERMIVSSSYEKDTDYFLKLTVVPAFAEAPLDADSFEIYPIYVERMEKLLSTAVALQICADEADKARYLLLQKQYAMAIRSLRLESANKDGRRGGRFQGDTMDNRNYTPGLGWSSY